MALCSLQNKWKVDSVIKSVCKKSLLEEESLPLLFSYIIVVRCQHVSFVPTPTFIVLQEMSKPGCNTSFLPEHLQMVSAFCEEVEYVYFLENTWICISPTACLWLSSPDLFCYALRCVCVFCVRHATGWLNTKPCHNETAKFFKGLGSTHNSHIHNLYYCHIKKSTSQNCSFCQLW